jgi:hypothetical protein
MGYPSRKLRATVQRVVLGATCTAGVLTLATARSEGQPATVASIELEWDAPSDCPSKEAVLGRITELLQGPPTTEAIVRARASRLGPRDWRMALTMRVGGSSGERTLRASSCEELADTAALVVALAIDPARVAAHEARVSAEQGDASAPPAGADAAPAPDAGPSSPSVQPEAIPSADTQPPSSAFVGERVTVGNGVAPGIVGGGSLLVGWEHGPWRLDLAGVAWSPRRQSLDGASSVGGRFTSYEGALRGCVRIARLVAEPFACAGAEIALIEAQGYGIDHPSSSARAWIGPTAGLALAWVLAPSWRLAADLSAAMPLSRPTFVIDVDRTTYRPAVLSVQSGVGLELRLF